MFGLGDRILAYIAAAIALAAAIYCVVLRIEVGHLESTLETRTAERDKANADIVIQNQAVKKLREETETMQQETADALARAQAVSQARQPAAKALQTRILANKDTCASAVAEIRKGLTK